MRDFFTVMAICNTVVVNSRNGNWTEHENGNQTAHENRNQTEYETVGYSEIQLRELKYEAESPDEAALVQVRAPTFYA